MAGFCRVLVVLQSRTQTSIERPQTHQVLWPALMCAKTAARYLDERSVRTFRSRVGKVYPLPICISGRGEVWRKADLDACIARLRGSGAMILDAADVL